MKTICLSFILFAISLTGISQTSKITLTFRGVDSLTQVNLPLESIYIKNLTAGCDTTISGASPSIILTIPLGIEGHTFRGSETFAILPPAPNPFTGKTLIRIMTNQSGILQVALTDLQGKVIAAYKNDHKAGLHKFEIKAAVNGLLLLNVNLGNTERSVTLINTGSGTGENRIVYLGTDHNQLKSNLEVSGFSFRLGDQLFMKSIKSGYYEKTINDSPVKDTTYTFELKNIPVLPTISTSTISNISYTYAAAGGEVTSDGGAQVTTRGICWSALPDPTLADPHLTIGSGTGFFSDTITDLTEASTYYVRAFATNSVGTAYGNQVVFTTFSNLNRLTGVSSKTWKLLRSTATGRYPLEVGPEDHSMIWWATGLNNNELANRPCMLNDEWTFALDHSLTFDAKGDYWSEAGVFIQSNVCASTSYPMVGINGNDLSAWGNGNHTFVLAAGSAPTLKAVGKGAYIGFYKLGNGAETLVPLDSVTYNIVKLTDGAVDTLIIEGVYRWDPLQPGGYWRFVLMHYDDPSQEPPIPGNLPFAGFTYSLNGLTVNFFNTSTDAVSYLWDFGDGATSIEMNPVHTYAVQGCYNVTLTATNPYGVNTISSLIFIGIDLSTLTNAMLQGAPWRVKVEDKTVFVGSGMGMSNWWSVPKSFFTGGGSGIDDWSCMPDDEFTFSAGGGFSYETSGSARNDGYMGTPNGCWSDALIAASGNGAAFGSCASHTYTFTPATPVSRPIITLVNGSGFAAFIGFYKGYYGGENSNSANLPNGGFATNKYEIMGYSNSGTKEYLFVTVDISSAHDESAAWSAILER